MGLRLADHWLWDFWFAQDGEDVHVFYLQAPRSLRDPELRHRHATIGHAVSRDLRSWRVLPDALGAGDPDAFDGLAPWTGSIIAHGGRWHLFYTGIAREHGPALQRVGLATSPDLVRWERHGLVCEADPRWYQTLRGGSADEPWRDPYVVHDDEDGRLHMLLTASAKDGPAGARGVVAHATSDDLRSWRPGPPLSEPGEFAQLEVPQLVHLGGRWRILFCALAQDHGDARRAREGFRPECGTHYLTGDARWGRYALDRQDFLVGDLQETFYAGRMLHHGDAWWFFAWLMRDERGGFAGELSDPMAVQVAADGTIAVVRP